MQKSLYTDIAKIVVVFGLIWAFFTFLPILKDDSVLGVPTDKERKVGEIIVNDLLSHDPAFKKLKNKKIDSLLLIVRRRLTDNLPNTEYHYKILVFDNQMINAFALPGGYIMVSTGLLNFVETPEELAAVMAHEMGHIEKKHLMKRLIKNIGIAVILSGDEYVIGELSKTVTSNVFDRKQEKEADLFSFGLMENSEINPRVLASFFRRLNQKQGGTNENLEILMTHPDNNTRINAALEYKMKPGFKEKKINVNWSDVKSELKPQGSEIKP